MSSNISRIADLTRNETLNSTYDANENTFAPHCVWCRAHVTQRVEGRLTYNQTFDAENCLISVTVSGQTTQFIYDGDGNLVKKVNPDNSKTIYPSIAKHSGQAWVESIASPLGMKWTKHLVAL